MQYAPQDHGVVAHFIIQDICRLAGIRNLIANVRWIATNCGVVCVCVCVCEGGSLAGIG